MKNTKGWKQDLKICEGEGNSGASVNYLWLLPSNWLQLIPEVTSEIFIQRSADLASAKMLHWTEWQRTQAWRRGTTTTQVVCRSVPEVSSHTESSSTLTFTCFIYILPQVILNTYWAGPMYFLAWRRTFKLLFKLLTDILGLRLVIVQMFMSN